MAASLQKPKNVISENVLKRNMKFFPVKKTTKQKKCRIEMKYSIAFVNCKSLEFRAL